MQFERRGGGGDGASRRLVARLSSCRPSRVSWPIGTEFQSPSHRSM